MHWFLVIYLFALFVIFSNNSLFSRAFMFKGKQLPGHLITAFAFALVLYFTYDYIHPDDHHKKESMILFNPPNKGLGMDLIKDKTNEDWVIVPPKVEVKPVEEPPSFTPLPIQCAADFTMDTACCGQPPAVVPFENTCGEDKPFCNGYIAFEKWGTCGEERLPMPKKTTKKKTAFDGGNKDTEFDPYLLSCKPVSELKQGNEFSIIGRFGKYIIWNVHDKTSLLSQEKIKIQEAGYMLLNDSDVPSLDANSFDGYDLQKCIIPLVDNYKNYMMEPFQRENSSAVFFPSSEKFSSTLNSSKIVNFQNKSLFDEYGSNSELLGYNIFMILIDPNY